MKNNIQSNEVHENYCLKANNIDTWENAGICMVIFALDTYYLPETPLEAFPQR